MPKTPRKPVKTKSPSNTKGQLNVRVSPEAFQALEALQTHHGISQAALIELLLRREARKEGLSK